MLFVSKDSHLDHNVSVAHLSMIFREMGNCDKFEIRTFDLEYHMRLTCEIKGPVVGNPPVREDQVTYCQRGDRAGKSRVVNDDSLLVPTFSDKMTVIVGPDESVGSGNVVLYTVYGGPLAPREPWDPTIQDDPALLAESKAFWAEHALVFVPSKLSASLPCDVDKIPT